MVFGCSAQQRQRRVLMHSPYFPWTSYCYFAWVQPTFIFIVELFELCFVDLIMVLLTALQRRLNLLPLCLPGPVVSGSGTSRQISHRIYGFALFANFEMQLIAIGAT